MLTSEIWCVQWGCYRRVAPYEGNPYAQGGTTPLMIAAGNGYESVVDLLLAANADTNIVDNDVSQYASFI
jgi:ankyrin repeat protein